LRNREELNELHGRLDQISGQLERLAQTDIAQRRLASRQRQLPAAPNEAVVERATALTGAPQAPTRASMQRSPAPPPATEWASLAPDRVSADDADASIERAVAEITARQRVLAGKAPGQDTPSAPAAPPLVPAVPTAPPETPSARAETLRPENAAASFATGPAGAESPRPESPQPRNPRSEPALAPTIDLSGLERQLRQITSRIEALRPASDLEKAIEGLRADLSAIGHSITEALPRRAVESLEIEIKALAQRIDHSRECGLDAAALAGLERGLGDVREALRGLTTAESLVGFDEAVRALSGKVDAIAAKDDPAALQQLETAIGGLRGVVAHVASNDALTKVAEDVRALSAKVDGLANSAASGRAVSALESRIDTLANALSASAGADQAVFALGTRIDTLASALSASTEAGHAVPQQLEKLLAGLIEKLEWVQLTHTDHAALAHLEDRIAMLVRRFDASDAHLVHLEAVGRGLADLLVHIEQLRGSNGKALGAAEAGGPIAVGAIERDVAEIKQTERRNRESLEAVQGTVEHVVDRLAMLESGMRAEKAAVPPAPAPIAAAVTAAAAAPPPKEAEAASSRAAPAQAAAPRQPIDPNLPPDHPLEPGSAGRSRQPSAADRIAASEAASGAKPPVIPDPGGKPDFIAAARRAAQAAAATALERSPGAKAGAAAEPLPKTLTQRLRKLIVPIAVVLIVIGGFRFVSRLFEGHDAPAVQEMQGEKTAAPATAPPEAGANPPPVPEAGAGPAAKVEAPLPLGSGSAAPPEAKPVGQSLNGGPDSGSTIEEAPLAGKPERSGAAASSPADVTGSLPRSSPSRSSASATAPPGVLDDKLPATIGVPALRAAALSGDPSAAYEVAMRFAEGRGVAQNNEEAAHWLDRAAKLGLAPAQFRLGSLYEKGIGVKKNLATARDLYRAAADKGHAKAMHNLAVLYAEGVDGAADYRTAAQWFRKAADRGVADSQYNLGILYARGIGVEQNFAESYKWFALAADHGDKDAAKKRDEVAAHLDPQSLAAARLAAQNWAAEPQPAEATEVKAWDPPASASPAPKPKPRSAGAKPSAPDAVKVD
jgi:localization factor PodJL